jgi:hypothetical protein
MKKVILFAVLTVFGLHAIAREKKEWIYTDGVLQHVFAIESSAKSTELLRLYDDGTFEHLKYTQKSSGKEEVQRNLGTFEIRKMKIHFNTPKEKDFSGKFRYGSFFFNGKLYTNLLDMKMRKKNEVFKRTSDQKFFKPFFICLNKNEVVNNSESAEQLDLQRLLDFILTGKRNEEEKVMSLIQLIAESVEYDHEGLRANKYANAQSDVKSILAGRKRLAVCAGYAHTFTSLCEMAGIKVETINGHTKQGFGELGNLGGYHAWNMAEVAGESRLYDVTWADDGETLDMRWIDVDPLVMIGSHFPDNAEHQLLSESFTQAKFLSTPVILPLQDGADPVALNIAARQFAGKNFRLALPGKHKVTVLQYPSGVADLVYTDELKGTVRSFTSKNVGSGHYDGDSTFFLVPLTEAINPLEITIDDQLEIKTVVFRGGQTDLMKHFIAQANRQYADAYVKGVIAAIRISDEKALKELLGDDNTLFFDRKGKLKIDKNMTLACLDWIGEVSALTKVNHTNISFSEDGEKVTDEFTTMHVDVPGKLRCTLEHDGVYYRVTNVELLNK